MPPWGFYVLFRLKLMFLPFLGNPRRNSKPKSRLMKGRTDGIAHLFFHNILQMKSTDWHNSLLPPSGWRIDLGTKYLQYPPYTKSFHSNLTIYVPNHGLKPFSSQPPLPTAKTEGEPQFSLVFRIIHKHVSPGLFPHYIGKPSIKQSRELHGYRGRNAKKRPF